MFEPPKFVNLYKFCVGNNRLCVLSLKAQIMIGIKDFYSLKFTGKNVIPRGLTTVRLPEVIIVRLPEVIIVGYLPLE